MDGWVGGQVAVMTLTLKAAVWDGFGQQALTSEDPGLLYWRNPRRHPEVSKMLQGNAWGCLGENSGRMLGSCQRKGLG